MKIVIPGGSGHVGGVLCAHFRTAGHRVVVLTRRPGASGDDVLWDGATVGEWAEELDGADAVINLAGRSVNCRYTAANLRQMMDSRVASTRAVGAAIEQAARPPRVWLQMSTATIYAHRFAAPNDEPTGQIGGHEPDAPALWRLSIEIAQAWERTLSEARTPHTRKVAMRSAMVMSPEPGGIFAMLLALTRCGLGGPIAGGRQFVSWIHATDFVRAVEWLLERDDVDGPVNLASPAPLPQRDFMAELRRACGVRFGLPASRWMVQLGAIFLRTETELILKSRRVVPGRLGAAGFTFDYPAWPAAAVDLVAQWRASRADGGVALGSTARVAGRGHGATVTSLG